MEFDLDQAISELCYLETVPQQEWQQHAGDEAVIKLANAVLLKSIAGEEEDILLESTEQELYIRLGSSDAMRFDCQLPNFIFPVLSMRLKQMAALDLSDVNSSQAGRMRLRFNNRDIDLRLTTHPGNCGEQLLLKVLK